ESAPGRLEDRPQVCEHLLGLLLDPGPDQLARPRLKTDLAGDEHEVTDPDRLRVRGSLERRGRSLGEDGGLPRHRYSFRLTVVDACASAIPSALKIASSTCCASEPSMRRTCSVKPAASASACRKSATTSLPSPATRASERSTFATTSGRPDAS